MEGLAGGRLQRLTLWILGIAMVVAALGVTLALAAGSGSSDPLDSHPSASEIAAVRVSAFDGPSQSVPASVADSPIMKEAGIDAASLHEAQDLGDGHVLWIGKAGKKLCLMVTSGANGAATCNDPSVIASFGSIPLIVGKGESGQWVLGMVSDEARTASIGTKSTSVKNNTFALDVAAGEPAGPVEVKGATGVGRRVNYDKL